LCEIRCETPDAVCFSSENWNRPKLEVDNENIDCDSKRAGHITKKQNQIKCYW
jgi:undecaprenyl pyrophosphate synthase